MGCIACLAEKNVSRANGSKLYESEIGREEKQGKERKSHWECVKRTVPMTQWEGE